MQTSEQFFERAQGLFPGGVNSPVRAFRAVGGVPRVIERGRGCYLFDVEGNRYVDYIGSWGAAIAGHAHPAMVHAVSEATQNGLSFGTSCPAEIELAEEMLARVPSLERVRMVNSGTEAVMSAIRLARAATGRRIIVKFDGCYHGHADAMLVSAGSGVATLGLPDSPGVTPSAAQDTMSLSFNDVDAVMAAFDKHGEDIAAAIVEPIVGNMGVVWPERGFLEHLREITQHNQSLLIFDEVMTGFRVARGGAQELLNIKPDLSTFGKIIGGGLPVGAYGGRADLMDQVAPSGPVYQAGTMSGNPIAMAAGLATLRLLDDKAYAQLEGQAAMLASGIEEALAENHVTACVQRAGSMLTLFFDRRTVRNLDEAKSCDHRTFSRFFHEMLRRGVHLPPSGYEAWFLSLAHDTAALHETLLAVRESLRNG